MFHYLESLDPTTFDADSRETLCTKLRELIARHRRFSHARWAMPSEDIDRLRAIYEHFQSEDTIHQVAPLFTGVPQLLDSPPLLTETEAPNREMYDDAVYQAQVVAARQVYEVEGLTGLLTLMEALENSGVLGWVLGKSGVVEVEEDRLLYELGSSESKRRRTAEVYVAGRFAACGWKWADERLAANGPLQTSNQRANFFLHLPPKAETWDRLERWVDDTVSLYWTQFDNLVEDSVDCLRAAEQLLSHGQAWHALDLVAHYVQKVQPTAEFVMNLLEKAMDTPLASPINQSLLYEIPQLLEYLEQMAEVDEVRLAQIEWKAIPLFRYEPHPLKVLYRQLVKDPQFFAELVSLAYRASDEAPSEVNEQEQARAQRAYDLLHAATVVPGMQEADSLDLAQLTAWVEEVRQILDERKRREVGDLCIGHLLSHAMPDANDVWPPNAIRELLEHLRSEDIERGIEIARHNARGVTWGNLTDGGGQERQLMEQYRAQAQAIQSQWSRTAALLRRLAQSYEEEARMHDREAELRQDGW